MTPARGLSFLRFSRPSPPVPAQSPLLRPFQPFLFWDFPPRAPFPPQMLSMLPTRTLSSHPIFPHKKPGRFFPQASFPSLHTQQFPSLQPPLFPSPPRPRHSPASQHLRPIPFSHVCPSPFFPHSLKKLGGPQGPTRFSHLHPVHGTPQRASTFPTQSHFLPPISPHKKPGGITPPG